MRAFSYAIVRVVPRVDREEFLNVGAVLYCHAERYLKVTLAPDWQRVQAAFPHADLDVLRSHLAAFVSIADGSASSSPIATLSVSQRFHWLTSARSTVIQTSAVHAGLCADLDAALARLVKAAVALP